ncbi:hypothetical protein N2152v2_007865 [Parachlorella kessleri]
MVSTVNVRATLWPKAAPRQLACNNKCRAIQPVRHVAPSPPRRLVIPKAVDPAVFTAATEVWSAIGAVSIAAASLYGLGKLIQQANYDPEDIRLQALRYAHSQAPAAPAAAAALEVVSPPAATPAAQTPPNVPQSAVEAPEARPEPVVVASTSTTTRLTEPFVAAKHKEEPAKVVLPGMMTADDAALAAQVAAPVAATAASGAASEKAESAVAAALAGKMTMDAAATAASLAGKMTVDTAAAEAAKRNSAEDAYQAKLNQIRKDSALAYNKTRQAQQDSNLWGSARQGAGLRQKVAALSQSYQEKIDTLWQTYEKRKVDEQVVLRRGDKILLDLETVEANKAQTQISTITSWWQRLLASFLAIWAWVSKAVAQLLGRGGSGSSAGSLGASA